MGTLEIRKYIVEPRIDKNGKFVFKAPIDWATTLKMWFEHKDARDNKILVRTEQRNIFRIIYQQFYQPCDVHAHQHNEYPYLYMALVS